MGSERLSAKEERELYELKHKSMQFYADNGVPQKMEEILNSTFYDNPNDVFGHLANYFESFAKIPTIHKLKAREAIDSRGLSTVQTEVYCTIKNHEKLTSSTVSSNESYPSDTAKADEKETAEEERKKSVAAAINLIGGEISLALWGVDPSKQYEADTNILEVLEKLRIEEEDRIAKEKEEIAAMTEESSPRHSSSPTGSESPSKGKGKVSPKGKKGKEAVVIIPDEPREKFFCGSLAVSTVSQAVCQTAAAVQGVPLYQHIAALRFDEPPSEFKMPLPMVTILSSGKTAPGKLNCVKEFMVVPKPGIPINQSLKNITDIYNHCAKVLGTKGGALARNVNDVGALCPQFDRPEQGLDLLQETMTALELTPGEHFHIALNCAGHEIFDYDKGKYEVITGQQKLAEDLVEFWSELLGRYPSVIAIIDPMRKQETESWMRLSEAISERCLVLGDHAYHRPGILVDEEIAPDFRTSGVVFKLEQMNSISDVLGAAKKMEDADNQTVIATSPGDSNDTLLVDLAIGAQVNFFKLGGPTRGERVAKINRLMQIESELKELGKLNKCEDQEGFRFPLVKAATPEPPVEEGDTGTLPPVSSPESSRKSKK